MKTGITLIKRVRTGPDQSYLIKVRDHEAVAEEILNHYRKACASK